MKMYTQEEVEQMVDEATSEEPVTAEGWLEHYNGNISRCAEALGVSIVTLRKHRDNGTLSNILVYSGNVYMYKNEVGAVSNAPPEAELVPQDKDGWELVPANKVGNIMKMGANWQSELKKGYKVTRDNKTGNVQYWRRKD